MKTFVPSVNRGAVPVWTRRYSLLVLLTLVAAWGIRPACGADKPAEKAAAPVKTTMDTTDWVFLDNGQMRLGVKKSSGAGIAWLSKTKSDRNLVNTFDRGRLIQQSYYGKEDGSMWDKQPWMWNPVQGGDWHGNSAKVLEFTATTNQIYAKTMAKHWATGADLSDVIFEEWIGLASKFALVRYRVTYSGKESHPEKDQEVPAFFAAPDLDTLVIYDGDQPWTNAALTRSKPGWPNETRKFTESWAAYVDKNDFGIGAFFTKATGLTCYRYGDGRVDQGACSYFAPTTKLAFTPGKVFEYEVYLLLGTLKELREGAYMVHSAFGSSPPGMGVPKK